MIWNLLEISLLTHFTLTVSLTKKESATQHKRKAPTSHSLWVTVHDKWFSAMFFSTVNMTKDVVICVELEFRTLALIMIMEGQGKQWGILVWQNTEFLDKFEQWYHDLWIAIKFFPLFLSSRRLTAEPS